MRNIFIIAARQLKQYFRDKKGMVMGILFPIVLILVLGNAFSKTNTQLSNIDVLYTINDSGEFASEFNKEIINKGKDYNIKFEKAKSKNDAEEEIAKHSKYVCYVHLDKNTIQLYKNSKVNSTQADLVNQVMRAFVQNSNFIYQIYKLDPSRMAAIKETDSGKSYVNIKSFNKSSQPSAMDYYAITMLTLVVFYGSRGSLNEVASEKIVKTSDRIFCSPVKKYEYLLGKTIGSFVENYGESLVVIVFSKYVYKVNWGSDIMSVFLILAAFTFMTTCLGIAIGFVSKGKNTGDGILNALIPVMCFLGGAYMPLDQFNLSKAFMNITKISPVEWTNSSIIKIIYSHDYSLMPYAISICTIIGLILIFTSAYAIKKEEV